MLFTGCVWVGQRLYTGGKTLVSSRREDLLVVGKSFIAVDSIVLRFQLIVKGRAKILPGVECSYATICRKIYAWVRNPVICSREVVYSWLDIL